MKKLLHHLFLVFLSIGALVLLNVGFIFLLVGFLPTVMAYLIDDDPQKNLYKCVRACNFAGMLPTLAGLIGRNYPGAALQVVMSDWMVWLMVFGGAFVGGTLIGICRFAAFVAISAGNQTRVLMLEQEQKEIEEEWGEDVTR